MDSRWSYRRGDVVNLKKIILLTASSFVIALLIPYITISRADSSTPDDPLAPNTDTYTFYIPFVIRSSNPPAPTPGNGIVINHQSLSLFNQIPDNYIQAASQLKLLFRHASVGYNISEGLNCLMNEIQPRPSFCDQNLPSDQIIFDPKYNRSNWVFEFHLPPPSQNPGWWDKYYLFADRVDNPAPNENFYVYGFKFGYVDGNEGSLIDDLFFHNNPNDTFPSIDDMLALEARHPNKKILYWTMALARSSFADSQSFNQQMRNFALTNGKILMDIAAIESHRPDGTPCYDNGGRGIEALCQDYTDEINGGHLNALGMQRMAKAMWIMMARIAGWNGQP